MDLNLSPDEIKFRDELRTWLAANAPYGLGRAPRGVDGVAL